MFDVLLYATMKCTDAAGIIDRVKLHDSLDSIVKSEIIVTVKDATPHCDWDAND